MIRNPSRLVHHLLGKFHGKLIRSGHRQHIHPGGPGSSQNLLDPSLGTLVLPSVADDPGHHLIPVRSLPHMLFGDKDILQDLLVVRNNESEIPAALVRSHHLGNAMAEDLHHLSLPAGALLRLLQPDLHLVQMESLQSILLRDIHILHALRLHKPEAFGICQERSLDQGIRRLFLSAAEFFIFSFTLTDLPFCFQKIQHLKKFLALSPGQLQQRGDILGPHRPVFLAADNIQNQFFSVLQLLFIHSLSLPSALSKQFLHPVCPETSDRGNPFPHPIPAILRPAHG